MQRFTFSESTEVDIVLSSSDFAPPAMASPADDNLTRLRSEMARFSHGDQHGDRRSSVMSTIDQLDSAQIGLLAEQHTHELLTSERHEAVSELGYVVPTATMATALGVPAEHLDSVRSDVLAIVEVIGRGMPATAQSNQAVDRLRHRFASRPDPVPAISLLYQNHDATAALFASMLDASATHQTRRSALAGTKRVALCPTSVGGTSIPAGTIVDVDLETSGREFGSGPHVCPGQELAHALAAGMVRALETLSYRVVAESIERRPDGRPATLPVTNVVET